MKRIFIISAMIFTWMISPAQNPYIQHYTTNDGLPSNTVYPIIKDSKNFIWFATDAGVARYDGTEFTSYSKKDGLSNNEIVIMKEDSQGRIWFVSLSGSVNYFYQNKIFNAQNAPFLDSLQSRFFFRNFFEDSDHTLYFYTHESREIVALNSQNQVSKFTLPCKTYTVSGKEINDMSIRGISKSESDGLVLWTSGGIYALKDFSDEPVQICDSLSFGSFHQLNDTRFLLPDRKLPGQNRKIRIYSDGILGDLITLPFYSESHLHDAIETEDGVLWLSTMDKGVFCLKNNKIINHIDIHEAQAIEQDHEGNVWISSMSDGVYKVSPYFNSHKHYGSDFFDNSGISAMCLYPDSGVWMTNGEGTYLLEGQKFYSLDFSLNQRKLNQIYYLRNNSLIVGTKNSDFFHLTDIEAVKASGQINYTYHKKAFPRPGLRPWLLARAQTKFLLLLKQVS